MASSAVSPTGFSIHRCLPASATATPISRCRKLGAVTLTAAISGSASRSRQSVYVNHAVRPRERLRGCGGGFRHRRQLEAHGQVGPVLGQALVGTGMDVTHPAGTDDADLERLHRYRTAVPSSSWASA